MLHKIISYDDVAREIWLLPRNISNRENISKCEITLWWLEMSVEKYDYNKLTRED